MRTLVRTESRVCAAQVSVLVSGKHGPVVGFAAKAMGDFRSQPIAQNGRGAARWNGSTFDPI